MSETIHFLINSKNNDHYFEHDIKEFVGSLHYNVVFDMGFKVLDGSMKDKINYYCLCAVVMEPWREQF